MSFMDLLLEYTKDFESPTSFWRWSGYATIAAVLRDNIYRLQGGERIYPNIYVLLLAASGVHRKGRPSNLGGDLVTAVNNTKIIRGRTSIQAVIDDLANVETDRRTGIPKRGGSCIMCAEELAAFFVQSMESVGILTDLYDSSGKKQYVSRLVGSGKKTIDNVCVTMLAASNETMLKEVYTSSAIKGGLLARTFLVTPNEIRKRNALMEDEGDRYDKKHLIASLMELAKLKGEVKFDDAAKQEYTEWYLSWGDVCARHNDETGVMARIHTGIVKLAIVKGIDRNRDLIVEREDVEAAIAECLGLIPNYTQFVMGQGKGSIADGGRAFIDSLKMSRGYRMTQKEMLYTNWGHFDLEQLGKIVSTFETAGFIKTICNCDATIEYMLTAKALEKFGIKETIQ